MSEDAVGGDAMADEFDVVPGWTVQAVRELGPDHAVPAACRGSGGPAALEWFADRLELGPGVRLLDSGAGVGGPAEWAVQERGCTVVLAEPMVGACRAAIDLFGRPTVAAAGEHLPFRSSAVDAAWSLGVLCVSTDQRGLLTELARVVRPGGDVGLLVYTRRVEQLEDQPQGNDFPTRAALELMLHGAGLIVQDRAELTELDATPTWWTRRQDAVADLVAHDHEDDERWRSADQQARTMTRLLDTGQVGGTLIHARTTPDGVRAAEHEEENGRPGLVRQ